MRRGQEGGHGPSSAVWSVWRCWQRSSSAFDSAGFRRMRHPSCPDTTWPCAGPSPWSPSCSRLPPQETRRAVSASVCGASGCRTADSELLNPIDGHSFGLASAPRPAPYYAAILSAPGDHGFCWRLVWVPARRVLRVENLRRPNVPGTPIAGRYWRTVHLGLARSLAEAVRGLQPYAPALSWRALPASARSNLSAINGEGGLRRPLQAGLRTLRRGRPDRGPKTSAGRRGKRGPALR
jgi:hypothetical protein